MKFIIIGLGNFGSALATSLTSGGHEVIGVDINMQKVEALKDKITHTINMNCTDMHSLRTLPLQDTDVVVVAIGEDFGSSLMATATLKQLKVRKLVSRSMSAVHRAVIEAIGVDEIISPEEESAERLSKRLEMKGVLDAFYLSDEYNIVEVKAPRDLIGKSIKEADVRGKFNINILTVIRESKNLLSFGDSRRKVLGVLLPDTIIQEGDILVLFGKVADIDRILS